MYFRPLLIMCTISSTVGIHTAISVFSSERSLWIFGNAGCVEDLAANIDFLTIFLPENACGNQTDEDPGDENLVNLNSLHRAQLQAPKIWAFIVYPSDKKWHFSLVTHCIDMAIHNAWHRQCGGDLDHLKFRRIATISAKYQPHYFEGTRHGIMA